MYEYVYRNFGFYPEEDPRVYAWFRRYAKPPTGEAPELWVHPSLV